MAEFTEVLRESNDLLNELTNAVKMDELHEIAQDIKDRERATNEFNKLFE